MPLPIGKNKKTHKIIGSKKTIIDLSHALVRLINAQSQKVLGPTLSIFGLQIGPPSY
jgi:hypothetical protein